MTIVNYFTGFPGWHAPSQYDLADFEAANNRRYYEMQALYATGFSWSRNGWGNSLALYIPLCLFLYSERTSLRKSNDYFPLLGALVILFSIFFSGTRNGFLASMISLTLFFTRGSSIKRIFFFLIVVLSIMLNHEIISNIMRLDSSDISAGRLTQYSLVPLFISNMPFWGTGFDTTINMVARFTEAHEIHNTLINNLIEFGWLMGIIILVIMFSALKYAFFFYKEESKKDFCLSLILISGLSSGLFEPRAVFGTLSLYSLWWFSFGFLNYNYNNAKSK